MSFMSDATLRHVQTDPGPSDDWTIAHELAHQWFGVLIPQANLADLWLSEGFATFMVAVMKEHRWGRLAYEQERSRWRASSRHVHDTARDLPVSLERPGRIREIDMTESELRERGIVYFRGALVLDKLRNELGDQTFWEGIRRYVAVQAHKPTRSEDLRSAMAAASGRDLRAFFERWVYEVAPDL
jgi:aminopeptidase N